RRHRRRPDSDPDRAGRGTGVRRRRRVPRETDRRVREGGRWTRASGRAGRPGGQAGAGDSRPGPIAPGGALHASARAEGRRSGVRRMAVRALHGRARSAGGARSRRPHPSRGQLSAGARLSRDLSQRGRSRPHALRLRRRGRPGLGRAVPGLRRAQESPRRGEGRGPARALRGGGAVSDRRRHAARRDPGRNGRRLSSAERGQRARAGPARGDSCPSVARAHAGRPHQRAGRRRRRRGGADRPAGRRRDHARRGRGTSRDRHARPGAGRRPAGGTRLRWKGRSMARRPSGKRRLMRNRLLAGLERLRAANERLGQFMNAVAGWLFVVCALFLSFGVLGRKFFNVSSRATVELTGYMLAFGIAWGLCDALTTRAHIRVDVLVTRMPLRMRAFMHALALAFLALLAFFFVWRGWAVVHDSWEFGAHDSSALTIPLVVPQALWAFGITVFFALTLIMLAEVVVLLTLGRRAEVDRMLGPGTLEEEAEEALEAAGLPVPDAALR